MTIPRHFHFLWAGARFPYFARLAIASALRVEPDARATLHVFGAAPAGAHAEAILRHPRVDRATLVPATAFDDLGVDAAALRATYARIPRDATSAQSNLLRYAVLARHGGIYLDTDLLVVRDFADLCAGDAFIGAEQVLAIDDAWQAGVRSPRMLVPGAAWTVGQVLARGAVAVPGRAGQMLARMAARLEPYWQTTGVNNAVIGARPGAAFLRHLLARAPHVDATVRYRLGPTLVTEVARAHPADVRVLPPVAFYAIAPSYSFRFFRGGPRAIDPATRVLHVVSSNHRALLDALEPPLVRARARAGVYYQVAATMAEAA